VLFNQNGWENAHLLFGHARKHIRINLGVYMGNEPVDTIRFTETDRIILDTYKDLVEGLGDYLGSGYELVLHSLENYDKSVIKIINGSHTGRKEGAPITDLALKMLAEINQSDKNTNYISYRTKNSKGEPLKSTTIAIPNENGRIIGLLCINFYLNTPLDEFIKNFFMDASENAKFLPEHFAENMEQVIASVVKDISETVSHDDSIMVSLKNKEIISRLYSRGIFKLRNAVDIVADMLDISKNTVYMHIRSLKKEEL